MMSCEEHDYIEIACLFRYPVRLTLCSGDVVECTALDTQRNSERQECIKVEAAGRERLIELDQIRKLEALVDNPHFTEVVFGDS